MNVPFYRRYQVLVRPCLPLQLRNRATYWQLNQGILAVGPN